MPQSAEQLETLFKTLRSVEQDARARLLAGCAEDDARLAEFFKRPLRALERDALATLVGIGTGLDRELARSLRRDLFDQLSLAFARQVCLNISLRVRSRLKIYTRELADAELAIGQAIAATRPVRAKRPLPRMFAIHRIAIGDIHVPEPPEYASEIGDWIDRLYALVRDDIERCIERSRTSVLAHGTERLGIIKARLALVIFAQTRSRERMRAQRG